MLSDGAKVKHIKSPNFISEMADSFNVAGLTTAAGSRITLVIGRDQLEITQETMIEVPGLGYRSQTLQEDMVLSRLVLANITIPLDAAKALVSVLQTGIDQIEVPVMQAPASE